MNTTPAPQFRPEPPVGDPPYRIILWPDSRLKLKAHPVVDFDEALRDIVVKLYQMLRFSNAAGISAPQVDVPLRVCVVDVGWAQGRPNPITLINPEVRLGATKMGFEEGCLSLPGERWLLHRRSTTVNWSAYDLEGRRWNGSASGFEAICIQHEVEHLDGVNLADHLSPLKKNILRKRMMKLKERAQGSKLYDADGIE